MAEFLEDNQDQGTPPLPSGYVAVKKTDDSTPPLPSGYEPLKKKESTESTSTTPKQNGASVQKVGSLGTPKIKSERELAITEKENVLGEKPRRITTDISKFHKEDEAFKQNVNKKLSTYRQSTKVLPEERAKIESEVKDEVNQQGIVNGIGTGLKQAWNKFVDVIGVGGDEATKQPWKASLDPIEKENKDAVKYFADNKVKATPEQIEQKAIELKTKDKITNLKQEKINDFLGNLDDQEKTYLEVDAQNRFKTISKDRQDLSNRISLNKKAFEQLSDDLKNEMPKESRDLIESEREKIGKYIEEDYSKFNESTKKLGTAEDELDAFKRNYGKIENIKGRALASLGEAGLQTLQGISYLRSLNPFDKTSEVLQEDAQESVKRAQTKIQESRNKLRPELQEVNLNNFLQYTTDLMANQTGTLATIAIAEPIAGASILGLGQAGQTYSDMYQANKKGVNYSPAQMALAPLVSGVSTGVLSELPTFKTLKNTGNVWKATLAEASGKELANEAIKKTSSEIARQVGKDIGKEVATESLDNIVQNMVKKDILGDKSVGYFDNSWKTLKDTALLTGMLNVGASPHVVMTAVKMFTPNTEIKALDTNANKIMELSQQLDNINLDESAKKMVEKQIGELTKNSSQIVNTTMKRIDGLTEEQVKKVYDSNKRQEKIKEQAQEVKDNPELPNSVKQTLLNGLEQEYKSTVEKSNEIVNAEIQKPTPKEELTAQPQAEVQKTEQENVELNTSDKFKKTVDLFNQINETEGGSKKRELVKERKAFLEEHPTVKYIDDNIREVTKQLEEKGELTKSGDCP